MRKSQILNLVRAIQLQFTQIHSDLWSTNLKIMKAKLLFIPLFLLILSSCTLSVYLPHNKNKGFDKIAIKASFEQDLVKSAASKK